MEFWNTIINTALLGSAKKQIHATELPPGLSEVLEDIQQSSSDPEEKFLQIAGVAFNYRQCGTVPASEENITVPASAPEEKPYCSTEAIRSLKEIIYAENISLLRIWLQHCEASGNIVPPEQIPYLFSTAEKHKTLQPVISSCCGKRGEWLSQFNPAWNFSIAASEDELWETGTPDQRRTILAELRKTDPARAREWLQQCWSQETAGARVELIKALSHNISSEDEPWLESLLHEKSQKVRDEVWNLLKQLPGSFIVRHYEEVISRSLMLNREKALMGLIKKNRLMISLPSEPDDLMLRTGIEKLSSRKDISDEEYILYQLLQFVPPSFLEKTLQNFPEEIIDLLNQDESGRKLIPAIASATGRFRDIAWARAFAESVDKFYTEVAAALPKSDREKYLTRHLSFNPEEIMKHAVQQEKEWSADFAASILRYTFKNPYQYSKAFYNQHIHLIPVEISKELNKLLTEEDMKILRDNNRSEHVAHLLRIKEQTIQAFNKPENKRF